MTSGIDTVTETMRALIARQEVLTENLANLRTYGYKQQTTATGSFEASLRASLGESGSFFPDSGRPGGVIGSLTTAIGIDAMFIDFSQGAMEQTGRSMDVGLEGDGFLRVRTPGGDFYSRGGALSADAAGMLVTEEGYRVLGANGEIALPPGKLAIGPDGSIKVDDALIGSMSVVEFLPGTELVMAGERLYDVSDPLTPPPTPAVNTFVRSGFLEGSNVDDVATMSDMVQVVRAYQACQRMLAAQDELVGQAVNEVGQA